MALQKYSPGSSFERGLTPPPPKTASSSHELEEPTVSGRWGFSKPTDGPAAAPGLMAVTDSPEKQALADPSWDRESGVRSKHGLSVNNEEYGMVRAMRRVGAVCLAVLIAGCGGGGGDEDKNCGDFAYQQDAQAWHNSHPNSDLDRDGDGIACESLPRRPSGGGSGSASGSSESLPSVMVFDLSGQVASIRNTGSQYVRTSVTADSESDGILTGTSLLGGQFALDGPSGREYVLDYGGPEGYPSHNVLRLETAYAWPTSSVATSLSSALGGTYNFMGQRCLASGCDVTYGQFSVNTTSLTIAVCTAGPITSCTSGVQRYSFESSLPVTGMPGVYRFRSADDRTGFIAFGTSVQGAIGISILSQDASPARISAFAARTSWTYKITDSPSAPFHAISPILTSLSGDASGLGAFAINDAPMPGFFTRSSNPSSLNMVAVAPARVLTYNGGYYTLWVN